MIEQLKIWTQSIIIAVIISIIIEMLLPEGSNKKYVKVVTGLYILYVIINPIFSLNGEEQIDELKKIITESDTVATISETDIANTYILNLQNSLRSNLIDAGIQVEEVKFYITSDYSDVAKIEIKIKNGIQVDENTVKQKVLEYYDIDKNNIIIY